MAAVLTDVSAQEHCDTTCTKMSPVSSGCAAKNWLYSSPGTGALPTVARIAGTAAPLPALRSTANEQLPALGGDATQRTTTLASVIRTGPKSPFPWCA